MPCKLLFLIHATADLLRLMGLVAGEVLALRHTKEAELLPAPAVVGESVIISDQLPAASIRPCTFRSA